MSKANTNSMYYFFMKVGNANCFLKHHQQLGGLWVGYDGDAIPQVNKAKQVKKGQEQADLRYMSVVSQEGIRDSIRVVSFDKDNLLIFKVTGPPQYLGKSTSIDWSLPENYNTFPAEWKKSVSKNYDGVGSKKFLNHTLGPMGWKLLPAKLIASIPRSTLLAPIDSLSVWQSFNRRTFQPMFALGGNHLYSNLNWLNDIDSLQPISISENETLTEGLFGKFIRTYFDSKLSKSNISFSSLSKGELDQTTIALMNPAQVETVALHLSNDLGFITDIGLGKGLDVADVKATVRHQANAIKKNRVQSAIKKLEDLGVIFSEKLRTSIEATSTIRFQCKARSTANGENLGTVLIVEAGTAVLPRFCESEILSQVASTC